MLGASLGAYPLLAHSPSVIALTLAGLALVALGASLFANPWLLGVTLLLLASELVTLAPRNRPGGEIVVAYAALLLVLGELGSFTVGLRAVKLVDRAVLVRRGHYLVAIAIGGAAAAGLCEIASRTTIRSGLLAATIGIASSVALVALFAALARRQPREPREDI